MKTLKNILLISLFGLLFIACSKDGEQGIQGESGVRGADGQNGEQGLPGEDGEDGQNGTDGTQGETGTANVIYSEWIPSEFPINIPLSQDSFVVEAPDLTKEIVENGLLLVFGRTSNPIDQIIVEQLPRPVFFRDQYYFHRYITTPSNEGPQQFTIEVLSTDGGFIGVPFFEEYRYFIIPGGNPVSGKSSIAYSKMSYAELSAHFNIPE